MTITEVNTWSFYYAMVSLVTLWNLGLTAITRQGKILHFILEFFDHKKESKEYFGEVANSVYDGELRSQMPYNYSDMIDQGIKLKLQETVRKYLADHKIFSDEDPEAILKKLAAHKAYNRFYRKTESYRFPSYVRDPVISCITCMASLHSLILYTGVVLLRDMHFNPLEWIAIAIPCAFTGELLWKLKKLIEQNLK